MYQATRLIELIGPNLVGLNLQFVISMGASPAMIEAVNALKDLKGLSITYTPCWIETGLYDLKSLADMVNAIPQLENLTIHEQWSLDGFRLNPNALSKLKMLSCTYFPNDVESLTHICKTAKDSLKVIRIRRSEMIDHIPSHGDGDIGPILKPIAANLEVCFNEVFTAQMTSLVLEMEFPKLRMFGSHDLPEEIGSKLDWLDCPMLRNLETIVMPYISTKDYWKEALESAGIDAFQKVPKLKHMIFTGGPKTDPQLVEAFQLRGIRCHCLYVLVTSYDDIMVCRDSVFGFQSIKLIKSC